jgi:DNA processing protein
MNDLEALVALTCIPALGPVKIRLLINYFGSAVNAWNASGTDLAPLPGFSPSLIEEWDQRNIKAHGEQRLSHAARLGCQLVPYTSPAYPKRLRDIPDHPVLLYVMGALQPQDEHSIAVVGTRNCSIYGSETAEKFSAELAACQHTVVSGLARGIDTAAHKGALSRGRTIAVIGSGLANIYPRENLGLARQIAENGAVISEFPMDTPPDRTNFPQRNRIVSGMTRGTLLIEAPLKSGAMITMHKALQQGRERYAIPGRIDQDGWGGNHFLIKSGKARLVETVQDILGGEADLFQRLTLQNQPVIDLTPEERQLLQIMPAEEVAYDILALHTKLHASKLNVLLMSLLLKKVVKEFPGKVYKKVKP